MLATTIIALGLISYASAACQQTDFNNCVSPVSSVPGYKTAPNELYKTGCAKVETAKKCLDDGGHWAQCTTTQANVDAAGKVILQWGPCIYEKAQQKYLTQYYECIYKNGDDSGNHAACITDAGITETGNAYLKATCEKRAKYAKCMFDKVKASCTVKHASFRAKMFELAQKSFDTTSICDLTSGGSNGVDLNAFKTVGGGTGGGNPQITQCATTCSPLAPITDKMQTTVAADFDAECQKVDKTKECISNATDNCDMVNMVLKPAELTCAEKKYYTEYSKCLYKDETKTAVATTCVNRQAATTNCTAQQEFYKCSYDEVKTKCNEKTASYYVNNLKRSLSTVSSLTGCADPEGVDFASYKKEGGDQTGAAQQIVASVLLHVLALLGLKFVMH